MHSTDSADRLAPALLEVYIQPRASRTEIAGLHDGLPKIRIAAPAVDDAANRALVEFLARRLGISPQRIRIVSGARSRRKRLQVSGLSAAAVRSALG